MTEKCKYGVEEENTCEDDACQQCEYRKVVGKDIVCQFQKETVLGFTRKQWSELP